MAKATAPAKKTVTRKKAPFVIQKLLNSDQDPVKRMQWVDVTDPAEEGQDLTSAADCEKWVKNNTAVFGSEEPLLRFVQVKQQSRIKLQTTTNVTFEQSQLFEE